MRRRGSYQAICHPRGITPPWLTSLRTFRRFIMGVAPPGPFPRRVRGALPRRAPREADACVHVTARESCAAWAAASHGYRRASGFAFRLELWRTVDLSAGCDVGPAVRCCFFLNRSFLCRDFVQRCRTDAGILAVRSAVSVLRLGFAQQLGMRLAFQIEDLLRFPQPCEYPAALYLLLLLPMNYVSGPYLADPYSFHRNSLRIPADPAPQPCVPSPQNCGTLVRHWKFRGAAPASVSLLSECAQLRRLVLPPSRCTRSGATRSSSAPAFFG